MANIYYTHQSVKNYNDASIFSDEYTWTILEILRLAGPIGMKAADIAERVEHKVYGSRRKYGSVSRSRIYGILRRLWQMNWIHRYYNRDSGAQHHAIAIDWGGFLVDPKYDHVILKMESDYIRKRLFPIFKEFIEKTIEDLEADSAAKKWLPQKSYCEICSKSHEADEFFSSIFDIATAEFMESEEYSKFRLHSGYATKEEQELD
jgi:hypothetical protein